MLVSTLRELLEFNSAHAEAELSLFGQVGTCNLARDLVATDQARAGSADSRADVIGAPRHK